MHESNNSTIALTSHIFSRDVLTTILRDGAQTDVGPSDEAEVGLWIDGHAH